MVTIVKYSITMNDEEIKKIILQFSNVVGKQTEYLNQNHMTFTHGTYIMWKHIIF
jgi:hypothetical protein